MDQPVRLGGRIPQRGHEQGQFAVCRAAFLDNESRRLFQQLEQEDFLKQAAGWPKEKFAERLAHFQCEFIALHPFYELNGRTTRLLFDLIAIYNGYDPIDYSLAFDEAEDEANAYILASISCVRAADDNGLRQIILAGLNKTEV